MKSVSIVDYEAGNLFSVEHACKAVGLNPVITKDPKRIAEADALILPGVGAFGAAMTNLGRLNLIEVIKNFVSSGRPFMGICLGMQLLFSESEEFGKHAGLDLITGDVVKFPPEDASGMRSKVPKMGWNRIFHADSESGNWIGTPLEKVPDGEFMYFVHSYYVRPANAADVLSITNYERGSYCSSVIKGNIFATQFHPEKSAQKGINIYQFWASTIR